MFGSIPANFGGTRRVYAGTSRGKRGTGCVRVAGRIRAADSGLPAVVDALDCDVPDERDGEEDPHRTGAPPPEVVVRADADRSEDRRRERAKRSRW